MFPRSFNAKCDLVDSLSLDMVRAGIHVEDISKAMEMRLNQSDDHWVKVYVYDATQPKRLLGTDHISVDKPYRDQIEFLLSSGKQRYKTDVVIAHEKL